MQFHPEAGPGPHDAWPLLEGWVEEVRECPRGSDLRSICVIGSGPIVIGQACEFDYAGCQALKVLREDGYRDDRRQLEPGDDHDRPGLRRQHLSRAARSRGRRRRARAGAAGRAAADARRADGAQPRDRAGRGGDPGRARRRAARRPGGRDPACGGPRALPRGRAELRPAGAALADRHERRRPRRRRAFRRSSGRRSRWAATAAASSIAGRASRVRSRSACARARSARSLVEESVKGWDEFELEVIRDRRDNVVVVCSIENLDPMGVHTGDSVTVAPQMTLPDEAYQELRDAAAAVIRAVGVETGGSNIQFARCRDDRRPARDRDEPARLALVRARLEGDGLPDREGGGEARRRLHARRDPERPDEDDAGELRADARLRRRQVPALRVREVPRRRHDARDADEERGGGDGHRPHLPGGVRQGVRQPRARCGRGDAVGIARPTCPRTCIRGSGASWTSCATDGLPGGERVYRRVDSCAGEVEATPTTSIRRPARQDEPDQPRPEDRWSSSSARARTGSARGSSSTTAASTRCRASARRATRR